MSTLPYNFNLRDWIQKTEDKLCCMGTYMDSPVMMSYNGTTGELTLTDQNGVETTVNLPLEQFLSQASYNNTTNVLTLTMSDNTTFDVDLSDLVDASVTPGGSNGEIQYNNAGAFAGSSQLIANIGTTNTLDIQGSGATSATNALRVRNSSGTTLMTVRNDGLTTVSQPINGNLTLSVETTDGNFRVTPSNGITKAACVSQSVSMAMHSNSGPYSSGVPNGASFGSTSLGSKSTFGSLLPSAGGGAYINFSTNGAESGFHITHNYGSDLLTINSTGLLGLNVSTPIAGIHNAIATTASTPSMWLSGTGFSGGTSTTTKPTLLIEPTGTTSTGWSTSGTKLGVNAETGFVGRLMDLQVNGASKASITGGNLTLNGIDENNRILITKTTGNSISIGFNTADNPLIRLGLGTLSVHPGGNILFLNVIHTIQQQTASSFIRLLGNINSTAGDAIVLSSTALTGAGGLTMTSGVYNMVAIGNAVANQYIDFRPATGTATFNSLLIRQQINTSGSYSGIVRGIYYDPILTSTTGVNHIALEFTSGKTILSTDLTSFGGTTSSFPALKRNGTGLDVRLADDSGFATLSAKALVLGGINDQANGIKLNRSIDGGTLLELTQGGSYGLVNICGFATNSEGLRLLGTTSGLSYIDGWSEGTTKAQNYDIIIGSRVNNTTTSLTGNTTAETGSNVQIGFATATNPRAILSLNTTTRGFMPPRMTATERDAVAWASTDQGMVIFETVSKKLQCWDGATWNNLY